MLPLPPSFQTRRPAPATADRTSFCPPLPAFTLLEVVIALTLLAIFSGTLFSIVQGSVRAATEIEKIQHHNDQVNRFIDLCRQTFQNLPNTATVALAITSSGIPVQQELTLSGMPDCFPFGVNPISYEDTIFGMRPDLEARTSSPDASSLPTYQLCLSRSDLLTQETAQNTAVIRSSGEGLAAPDDQGRYWMPLVPDITSLSWRAYNEDTDTWEEEWDSVSFPPLLELNLLLKDRSQPIRVVFTLPATKLTAANPANVPTESTTSTTTTTTTNAGSSGGNTGRGGGQNQGSGRNGNGDRGNRRGDSRQGQAQGQPQGGNGSQNSQNRPGSTQPSGGSSGSTQSR